MIMTRINDIESRFKVEDIVRYKRSNFIKTESAMNIIEERACEAVRKEYLCESCAYKDNCDFCGGENIAFDCCECPADSYKDGFMAVYKLPLSDRLTAEEREKIKTEYAQTHPKDLDCDSVSICMSQLLERIFGKEIFVEEGGKE